MKICVIGGAGYVGLVTGLGFAELGHDVVNVDVDEARVQALQQGRSPIYEEGIEPLLERNLASGRLRFCTELGSAVRESEVVFIAVGTPSREDGQADLSQIIRVTEDLVQHLNAYKVVVIKSTVPVGTVELVQGILRRDKREGTDFDIVSNPEFLREGKGLYDFFYPDRIVVGTGSPQANKIMADLYAPVLQRRADPFQRYEPKQPNEPIPLVETDLASAQMIKYASNAFLATRISFINEVAGLCERVGADVQQVTNGMGYDARIGHAYLQAGLGFGGPCLDKDLRALIKIAESNDYEPRLLREVLGRNEQQLREVVSKIKQLTGYLLYKKIVAVFGLAFKAGTNDVRTSLSIKLIEQLEREGALVQAHDPLAVDETRALYPDLNVFDDPYEAASKADVLVIATDWPEYRELDFERLKAQMAQPGLVDGRNLLDGAMLVEKGFRYLGLGR